MEYFSGFRAARDLFTCRLPDGSFSAGPVDAVTCINADLIPNYKNQITWCSACQLLSKMFSFKGFTCLEITDGDILQYQITFMVDTCTQSRDFHFDPLKKENI